MMSRRSWQCSTRPGDAEVVFIRRHRHLMLPLIQAFLTVEQTVGGRWGTSHAPSSLAPKGKGWLS
jgi:hypothetical protein